MKRINLKKNENPIDVIVGEIANGTYAFALWCENNFVFELNSFYGSGGTCYFGDYANEIGFDNKTWVAFCEKHPKLWEAFENLDAVDFKMAAKKQLDENEYTIATEEWDIELCEFAETGEIDDERYYENPLR